MTRSSVRLEAEMRAARTAAKLAKNMGLRRLPITPATVIMLVDTALNARKAAEQAAEACSIALLVRQDPHIEAELEAAIQAVRAGTET